MRSVFNNNGDRTVCRGVTLTALGWCALLASCALPMRHASGFALPWIGYATARGATRQDPEPKKTGEQDPKKTGEQDPKKTGEQDPKKTGEQDPKKTGEQDPKTKPTKPPVDETEAAAEALRRLLQGAKPVEKPPPPPVDDGRRPLRKPPKPESPKQDPKTVGPTQQDPKPRTDPPDTAQKPTQQDPERRDEADIVAEILRGAMSDPPDQVTSPLEVSTQSPVGLPDESAFPIAGSLSTRFRYRQSRNESDQNVVGLLALDFGDEMRHPVTGHFLGRAYYDTDGGERSSTFDGIEQTFDSNVNGRLYEAFVDLHEVDELAIVRAGRQTIYETPEVAFFDGVRVESARSSAMGWWAGAYFGIPTHLYESSTDGDLMTGASGGVRPWTDARLRLDWMYIEDERRGFDDQNDLFAVSLWQSIEDLSLLHFKQTWIEREARDVLARGNIVIEDLGVHAQLSYFELLHTQRQLVTEADPFWDQAFDEAPYRQVRATVDVELDDDFNIGAGMGLRRLRDQSDEQEYNREFDRVYLTPLVSGLWNDRVAISLTGEYWGTDGGEDTATFGGDVTIDATDETSISLGSAYYLYKFDGFDGRERDHVRIYYGRFDWDVMEDVKFDFRYEYEDGDFEDFHTFRTGLRWSF